MRRPALIAAAASGVILVAVIVWVVACGSESVGLREAQQEFAKSVDQYPKLLLYYDRSADLFAADWMEKEMTLNLQIEPASGVITGAQLFSAGQPTRIIQTSLGRDPEKAAVKLQSARWSECVPPAPGAPTPSLVDQLPEEKLYQRLGYEAERSRDGTLTYQLGEDQQEYSFRDGLLREITYPAAASGSPLAKVEITYPDRDQPLDFSGSACP